MVWSLQPPGSHGLPVPLDADAASGRKNMLLLVQLRWIAVVGQILTIALVHVGLGIALPLLPMSGVLAGLVLLNLASLAWLRRLESVRRKWNVVPPTRRTSPWMAWALSGSFRTGQSPGGVANLALFLALLLDAAALTAQLALSGGVTNPFTALYLLQITLGAVLLGAWASGGLAAVAAVAVAGLTVVYRPLVLPPGGYDLFQLFIVGEIVGLALGAGLIVTFVTRIARNLRERDAGLAALRQHAAEEDHIVRMGLLASGAAHELGTPLASLSVILGDWHRMPALAADPEIVQEIEEMQAEVGRCKAIVTGILLAAGAARGEAPHVTRVSAFVAEIAREWRTMRASDALHDRNAFGEDRPIIADTALRQVIFNVLDNAYEVSPARVDLVASRESDALVLRIADAGPGFAPEMLAQLGKPYQSSKGRLGGGLGLFLVVNVVRKLGGSVAAANRAEGGAVVTLSLPLAALTPEEDARDG